MKPLENIIVLELCQYMAGPSAGLRLADLGARVIKVERPLTGDAGRQLAIKDLFVDENSVLFHTINRNKESYAADLKNPRDLEKIRELIAKADVLTHNFRPGVMKRLGLDYQSVRRINPRIIYSEITGYGSEGPWRDKPGQDLLIQALSGLTWLSGDKDDPPTPFGLSIADTLCGIHLTQGILAALIRRHKTGMGALIEVNLLASVIDFQFEVITTYLNDGGKDPERAIQGNGHAYLSAPYGVYRTRDGFLVLAMGDLVRLGQQTGCEAITKYDDKNDWFLKRDEILRSLGEVISQKTTGEWLAVLEPADIWCAEVMDYGRFLAHEGYRALQMDQQIRLPSGKTVTTTRCPIRIDGERYFSSRPGPVLGADTGTIDQEFSIRT